MHSFYRTHISTLSITCIHIIKYVHSFYYTHISVCHFVGVFIYAGTINRPLRLLVVCDNTADGLPITWRTPTKWGANIPSGVGADSSRPCPNIIKNAYFHYQICAFTLLNTYIHFTEYVHLHYRTRISTLSNMCIHIIKYTFPHHRTRIFVCHFVGVFIYAGTINRPLRLLTDCQNIANGLR